MATPRLPWPKPTPSWPSKPASVTRLAALDLRARALDYLGERAAARRAWSAQAQEAAAAGRTQDRLRALFQLGKQEFFAGGGLDRLREAVEVAGGPAH